ncbi:hypothetical protein ACK1X7_36845 [Streptomyces sp. CY1]|uniref:hypothetical protein n=1 Tax=Streptomyces sp. CY1 TaxID=3388313 RepID=UPI0039A09F8A
MEPFVLHEKVARDWLTELVVAHEVGIGFGEANQIRDTGYPRIGIAWRPTDPGEEDGVFLLVRAAQMAHVLTSPDEMILDCEFVDDGDEGLSRWLLDIALPAPLKLATPSEALPALGEPDVFGVEAALAILREAAQAASLLLQQLSDYLEASEKPGHGS